MNNCFCFNRLAVFYPNSSSPSNHKYSVWGGAIEDQLNSFTGSCTPFFGYFHVIYAEWMNGRTPLRSAFYFVTITVISNQLCYWFLLPRPTHFYLDDPN